MQGILHLKPLATLLRHKVERAADILQPNRQGPLGSRPWSHSDQAREGLLGEQQLPKLAAAVFERLGLALPMPGQQPLAGEPVQRQVERSVFELAIALNRLRKGRDWPRSSMESDSLKWTPPGLPD